MIIPFNKDHDIWLQNTTYEKPMLVILHLYYLDLLDWYLPYLKNITVSHDIFITVSEIEPVESIERIITELPHAGVYLVENKGMDVAPFVSVLQTIVDYGYRYKTILKIHSKKSLAHEKGLGERWRKDLVNALLFNNGLLEHYHNQVAGLSEVKMVGSKNWILKQKIIGYEQNYFNETIRFDEYNFVAGTMFLVNFKIIIDWFLENNIYDKVIDRFPNGYDGDGTVAHELERVFGCLINVKGYKILGA